MFATLMASMRECRTLTTERPISEMIEALSREYLEDRISELQARIGASLINRQEFDVVTLRNNVIGNVQCKNNFVDLERVDSDAVAFAR